MRKIHLLALVALTPLAACSSVVEAVKGPTMAPMGYPSELVGENQVMTLASAREGVPQPASANSLWRSGARAVEQVAEGDGRTARGIRPQGYGRPCRSRCRNGQPDDGDS